MIFMGATTSFSSGVAEEKRGTKKERAVYNSVRMCTQIWRFGLSRGVVRFGIKYHFNFHFICVYFPFSTNWLYSCSTEPP